MAVDTPQLPTPPDDDDDDNTFIETRMRRLRPLQPLSDDTWRIPPHMSNGRSSLPSPSPDELPGFEESQSHELIPDVDDANIDPLFLASERYDLPDPNAHDDDDDVNGRRLTSSSPSSSTGAEVDEEEEGDWDAMHGFDDAASRGLDVSPGGSPSWQSVSRVGSPSESSGDDGNPFGDLNVQKRQGGHDHGDTDIGDS